MPAPPLQTPTPALPYCRPTTFLRVLCLALHLSQAGLPHHPPIHAFTHPPAASAFPCRFPSPFPPAVGAYASRREIADQLFSVLGTVEEDYGRAIRDQLAAKVGYEEEEAELLTDDSQGEAAVDGAAAEEEGPDSEEDEKDADEDDSDGEE